MKLRISIFDLIMDSGISNVFIDAATAINTKGLKFRLVVCLILLLFFLNSAECQPPNEGTLCFYTIADLPCKNTTNECNGSDPLSCVIENTFRLCCYDGCRYICEE
ncbi:UNVERIFIED_CONTAM: hypothetical protein RMT77_011136 [Armadillidium vulgare]